MSRQLAALVAAMLTIAALVAPASASAERIQFEPAGAIEVQSFGQVTFEDGRGFAVQCQVELRGILLEVPIEATAGFGFGQIEAGAVPGCRGGRVTLAGGTMPWSLTYFGPVGEAPNELEAILFFVEGMAFTVEAAGQRCPYAGAVGAELGLRLIEESEEPEEPAVYANGRITTGLNATLQRGGGRLCPGVISVVGSFALGPEQVVYYFP